MQQDIQHVQHQYAQPQYAPPPPGYAPTQQSGHHKADKKAMKKMGKKMGKVKHKDFKVKLFWWVIVHYPTIILSTRSERVDTF